MSDRFRPLAFEQVVDWAAIELETRDSLFGIPRPAFFVPRPDHPYRRLEQGVELEAPWGVAAGPHTQLAPNIVAAWLAGARVIELKTVQDLDEIEIHRPCIDVTDEGYNVEWSQELRIHESFDEYLRAWVLVHALHRTLGFPGERPGVAFQMSVGYDLAGIRGPKVQWYLDAMNDASRWLPAHVETVARRFPAVREIAIPARISDAVTLSTMHGCPPDEIERIARYLVEERGLHTAVKCNPTLLGAEPVRAILGELGYRDITVPDSAFDHDLRLADAVPMFERLRRAARDRGVAFGLKLSNTLEVANWRTVFERDETTYLSGRALHPLTVNLAELLADELGGDVPFSFAGGADAFNVAELLACGLRTVTVCTDLLKTGGYLRLLQYAENAAAAFDAVGALAPDDFVRRSARAAGFAGDEADVAACARFNLRRYAARTRGEGRYRKGAFQTDHSKTARQLGLFDCIAAPCLDGCPIDQQVPAYMRAVREGDFAEAVRITRLDNPLPAVLGRVCDHHCEQTCVRTHLDEPLAIRHIKRFIMDQEREPHAALPAPAPGGPRVAVIGAGPAGLAAAEWLARAGLAVTIFEERSYPGGMTGGAIPAYRLPLAPLVQDLAALARLGVEIRHGVRAGRDVTIDSLSRGGFGAVFLAVGALRGKRLGLAGEDAAGVLDGVAFLRGVREGRPVAVGPRVGVVGGGDTAIDCARTARRLGAAAVQLVYRRTLDQMPADRDEVRALLEEGIEVLELARPVELHVDGGRLAALTCRRTEYRGERGADGRRIPHDVPGSEFELPLDTLILATGQAPALEVFGDRPPALTPAGFVEVDRRTLATSIPGVYAGGDMAGDGPASVVRAAADGKRAAAAIAAALGLGGRTPPTPTGYRAGTEVDLAGLAVRRARREYRVPVRSAALDHRDGFEETVLAYTPEEARREASRCLDCDVLCSLCVGVCPNLALFTYETAPARVDAPLLAVRGGRPVVVGATPLAVEQRFQVAMLADLCNECGACVTACPTSGRPYRDKPRLYVDGADFEGEVENAFRLLGEGVIEGRFGGATHRLAATAAGLEYQAPGLRAVLEPATLTVRDAAATAIGDGAAIGDREGGTGAGGPVSLAPAAVLATLLAGLTRSSAHLPSPRPGAGATRVEVPNL